MYISCAQICIYNMHISIYYLNPRSDWSPNKSSFGAHARAARPGLHSPPRTPFKGNLILCWTGHFKPDCGHNIWIEISLFWHEKNEKNRWNFIPITWEWTTECFKPDCGHNIWIEISLFWHEKNEKNRWNFIPITWEWTTECFMDRNLFF